MCPLRSAWHWTKAIKAWVPGYRLLALPLRLSGHLCSGRSGPKKTGWYSKQGGIVSLQEDQLDTGAAKDSGQAASQPCPGEGHPTNAEVAEGPCARQSSRAKPGTHPTSNVHSEGVTWRAGWSPASRGGIFVETNRSTEHRCCCPCAALCTASYLQDTTL